MTPMAQPQGVGTDAPPAGTSAWMRLARTMGRRSDPAIVGTLIALVFAAPIIALLVLAFTGDADYLEHIAATRLAGFATSSAGLAILSGGLAALVGTGGAWLVTQYEFAGRSILSWLLLLPLAVPGYVAAYSWYDLTAPGGHFYTGPDGPVPTISGLWGASAIFGLTLYPYVYLLARNAFEAHGRASWDMARCLGAGPLAALRRVALPLVWPAVAAGSALVAMEALADYGVTDFLGVGTLTVGIVRAWSSFGDPQAAAQLAVMLLFATLLALGIERMARGRRQFAENPGSRRAHARTPINGWRALVAQTACLMPLTLGLIIPAGNLALMAIETQPARPVMPALQGTLFLALASAGLALLIGTVSAYALRAGPRFGRMAVRLLQAGYAVPGAVAAIAILALLVLVQDALGTFGGSSAPLITGGSILALLFAYQSRFAAVAILPCENALLKIRRELDEAARMLGSSPAGVMRRVHLPLAARGLATAALLVGVEVMKELPATMILRPFDLETLAVTAHNYASDERLAQAALPALVLLTICIPATAMLNLLRVR